MIAFEVFTVTLVAGLVVVPVTVIAPVYVYVYDAHAVGIHGIGYTVQNIVGQALHLSKGVVHGHLQTLVVKPIRYAVAVWIKRVRRPADIVAIKICEIAGGISY